MTGPEDATAPLLGRERELAQFERRIKEVAGGGREALLLLGPAGIGKTTLLKWCATRSREERFLVSTVRIPAGAGLPPRYPIGEVLTGLVGSCDRLRLGVPSALTHAERALVHLDPAEPFPVSLPHIADAIESVAASVPVAIFIDDYHNAPKDGVGLLMAALRAMDKPLLFLASARLRTADEDDAAPLPEPTADLWIEQVRVAGLDAAGVEMLVARELGGPALPSLIEAVRLRTGGNPLFVLELLRSWAARGALGQAGSYWGLTEDPGEILPPSLQDLVTARLTRLEPAAKDTADAMAVVGRDARFDLLARVTTAGPEELVHALQHLEQAGIFATSGDPPLYRFAHPTYQSALLKQMTATARAALHERVFEGLTAESGRAPGTVSATELAHHAQRSISRRSHLRFIFERAASEADAVGSYEEAARWYGHLAEEARDDPVARTEALQRQGHATASVMPRNALPIFDLALSEAEIPAEVAKLLLGRATVRRRLGDLEGALADLDQALPQAQGELELQIRSNRATIFGIRGDLDQAERLLLELAEVCPTGDVLAGVFLDLGQVAHTRGDVEAGKFLSRQALRMAQDPSLRVHALLNEGWSHALLGAWDLAANLHEQALEIAARTGDKWNSVPLKTNLAQIRAWEGRFAEAYDLCLSANRDAERLGRVMDHVDSLDALGAVHLEAGAIADALAALQEAARLTTWDIEVYEPAVTFSNLAEAHRRLGDPRTALSVAQRAGEIELPFWRLRVARVHAACLVDLRDPESALQHLGDAIAATRALDPFEFAHCQETLAAATRAMGDRGGALQHLANARRIYEALGSPHSAERCGQPHRRGRPRAPRIGQLTRREAEVAVLVARGNTDREIGQLLLVSERTVSKHISNALAKLGAKRRAQIAAYVTANRLDSRNPRVQDG